MPTTTSKPIKITTVLQEILKDEPRALSPLKVGDVAEGVVIDKGSRRMLVDLGRYGTGAVYGGELQSAREMVRGLEAGGRIAGKVTSLDNEEGFVELSIAEAGKQKAWDQVLELRDKDEPITARASGFNKGGLIIDLCGLKAFLPLSQLSLEHYPKVPDGDKAKIVEELQELMKQEIAVKIIDVNPKMNKLIVSERAALEESMKELVKQYEVGQTIEGVVSGVAGFGVFLRFADNPAVEGLIHISELDHRIIENPKEVVAVDDTVKAKIVEIKDGKVYLSLKALKTDPWAEAGGRYREGDEVSGSVYAFNPFGAVVSLPGGLQGQIHITEFGGAEEMRAALRQGAEYSFIILAAKPEEKRIYLKLKK